MKVRFTCQVVRRLQFPVPASNTLRGAIGFRLHEFTEDAYGEFFAPRSVQGPSGLADPPRPFLIRAQHLDGTAWEIGQRYWFDLHLFDLRRPWLDLLAEILQTMPRSFLAGMDVTEVEVPLAAAAHPVEQLRVRFLTPTELKAGGRVLRTPEFAVLLPRVRDRISTLSELYGDGPLPLDFAEFGARAAGVRMIHCDVQEIVARRTSRRTGQTHSLGGFAGEAVYTGVLGEFLPYLRAAEWTGVGRQTTWGKGAIQVVDGVMYTKPEVPQE